jgi:hypothetical protein
MALYQVRSIRFLNLLCIFEDSGEPHLFGFRFCDQFRHLSGFPQNGLVISLSAVAFSCGMSSDLFCILVLFYQKRIRLIRMWVGFQAGGCF